MIYFKWFFLGVWFVALNYTAIYGLSIFCSVLFSEQYAMHISTFLVVCLYGALMTEEYIARNKLRKYFKEKRR